MEKLKEFTLNFFNKINADITKKGDVYIITNVVKSFQDFVGKPEPYEITFDKFGKTGEFISQTSNIFRSINRYLENAGKTTLLKIDFPEDLTDS
jgi:hypothetical protein